MKAAPFDYLRAESVEQVCALLAQDPNARVIAGGQTLVPMMAMRLARPTTLIDISRIDAISGISRDGNSLRIGAMTRQREVETSALVANELPLLAEAIRHVGHLPTRHRGTVGGSIVNADPSAEIPLVATILDAELHIQTPAGVEVMVPDEFFLGPMLTTIPEDGCLVEIRFPAWNVPQLGVAFDEISARRSDYAYVAAGAQVALAEKGAASRISVGIGGVEDRPVKLDLDALVGEGWNPDNAKQVIAAECEGFDPMDDLHASAAYRARVAKTYAFRVLERAWTSALNTEPENAG